MATPNTPQNQGPWLSRHPIFVAFGLVILVPLAIGAIVSATSGGKADRPSISSAPASRSPEEIKQDEAALASLKKTYDDIDKVTDYTDPSSPADDLSNNIHLYIRKFDSGTIVLRLRISYAAKDWLFVRKYVFDVDGATYEMVPNKVQRDNYTSIWEWSDDLVDSSASSADEDKLALIRAVIDSKITKMRYEGDKYYSDRTVTASEKAALKNVLRGYAALEDEQPPAE